MPLTRKSSFLFHLYCLILDPHWQFQRRSSHFTAWFRLFPLCLALKFTLPGKLLLHLSLSQGSKGSKLDLSYEISHPSVDLCVPHWHINSRAKTLYHFVFPHSQEGLHHGWGWIQNVDIINEVTCPAVARPTEWCFVLWSYHSAPLDISCLTAPFNLLVTFNVQIWQNLWLLKLSGRTCQIPWRNRAAQEMGD